jgi:hypothetical protein
MTVTTYTLDNIYAISANNFEFIIPENTLNIINYLTKEVGSDNIILNPLFKSKKIIASNINDNKYAKKKKNNKVNNEIDNSEWENLRTFQSTKIDVKVGLDNEIDQIRLHLNKLTDKTYNVMKDKIIKNIENVLIAENAEEYYNKISTMVYEISSNNKFYSKIYANLYKELVIKYSWLKDVLDDKLNNYLTDFDNIEYVEPNDNYDKYCELNKLAETRKSQSLFYVNLVKNDLLKPIIIYKLLRGLIEKMLTLINVENKKNNVDDIVENIVLLYDEEIIEIVEDDDDYEELVEQGFVFIPSIIEYDYDGRIIEFIKIFTKCKPNDFKSLTNKSIFKFMDLLEL